FGSICLRQLRQFGRLQNPRSSHSTSLGGRYPPRHSRDESTRLYGFSQSWLNSPHHPASLRVLLVHGCFPEQKPYRHYCRLIPYLRPKNVVKIGRAHV